MNNVSEKSTEMSANSIQSDSIASALEVSDAHANPNEAGLAELLESFLPTAPAGDSDGRAVVVPAPPASVDMEHLRDLMKEVQASKGQPFQVQFESIQTFVRAAGLVFGSDAYNGLVFALLHEDRVAYVENLDLYRAYRDGAWRAGSTAIQPYSLEASKEVQRQAEMLDVTVSALFNRSKRDGMMDAAKQYLLSQSSDFDADPHLLNVANGTLDLRTGELLGHSPAFRCTKMANVHYDRQAQCPQWDTVIEESTCGDTQLGEFLQQLGGIALLGDNRDHQFPILVGPGGSGKSTILNTQCSLLGDYGYNTSLNTLAGKGNNLTFTDAVGQIEDARMLVVQETDSHETKLRSGFVRSLSASDPIQARMIRKSNRTFKPKCTPFLGCNVPPTFDGSDSGLGRRLLVVPIKGAKPQDQMDNRLAEKLKPEYPAILLWMLKGLMTYWKTGLCVPASVVESTRSCRMDMDPIGECLGELFVFGPGQKMHARKIFDMVKDWCSRNGEPPVSQRALGLRLAQMQGVKKDKLDGQRAWYGIGPKLQFWQQATELGAEEGVTSIEIPVMMAA